MLYASVYLFKDALSFREGPAGLNVQTQTLVTGGLESSPSGVTSSIYVCVSYGAVRGCGGLAVCELSLFLTLSSMSLYVRDTYLKRLNNENKRPFPLKYWASAFQLTNSQECKG